MAHGGRVVRLFKTCLEHHRYSFMAVNKNKGAHGAPLFLARLHHYFDLRLLNQLSVSTTKEEATKIDE